MQLNLKGLFIERVKHSEFDWINIAQTKEVESLNSSFLPLLGKRTLFYGITKKYFFIWILPMIGIAYIKMSTIDKNLLLDPGALLFVSGFMCLFFLLVYFVNTRSKYFYKTALLKNKNREIAIFKDGIAISVGELARGEVNSTTTWNNELGAAVKDANTDYLIFNFVDCKKIELQGHELTLHPFNDCKSELTLTIGDERQDQITLKTLENHLRKNQFSKNVK